MTAPSTAPMDLIARRSSDAEACADLSRRLNTVFAEWARSLGYERGWQLDLADGEEIRPVLTLARAEAC